MENLPRIKDYIATVHPEDSSHYFSSIESSIIEKITLAADKNLPIYEYIELLCLHENPKIIIDSLADYTKKLVNTIDPIINTSPDSCNPTSLIKLEITLSIIFEIADDIKEYAILFNQASPIFINTNWHLNYLSGVARSSFLKGVALSQVWPDLIRIMGFSRSDDARSFLLIHKLLTVDSQVPDTERFLSIIDLIDNLSEATSIKLAKDLRRLNIDTGGRIEEYYPTKNNINIFKKLDEVYGKYHNSKHGDEAKILSQILLYIYSGLSNPSFLLWLKNKTGALNLNPEMYNTICALAGYDIPLFSSLNLRYFLPRDLSGMLAPARFNSLAEYYRSTLDKWRKSACQTICISHRQPLVSVLITTYNPSIELFKCSLESIQNQAYRNIEIIVVDDCSEMHYSNAILEIIQSYSINSKKSISYQRNSERKGQYVSRNIAMESANGSLITVQDDDDISHPARILLQAEQLLMNDALVAVQTTHIRISEKSRLLLDGNNLGEIFGDSLVSFMWRSTVFERAGKFSSIKSRGDVDFRKRITSIYGPEALGLLDLPLIIARGSFKTISSTKEYYYRSAVNAIRKIISLTNEHDAEFPRNSLIPYNLR